MSRLFTLASRGAAHPALVAQRRNAEGAPARASDGVGEQSPTTGADRDLRPQYKVSQA